AMTDHGNMFGAVELQNVCSGTIKPIFGCAIYVVAERPAPGGPAKPHQLIVLAETLEGYKNLVRLVSAAWLAGVDREGRPLVDHEMLAQYSKGLIALSGDIGGEVPHALLRGDRDRAVEAAKRYLSIFGVGNFFFEVQRVEGLPDFADACSALVDLGAELDIPCVATNNVHYLNDGEHEAHGILMCIGMEKRIDRPTLAKVPIRSLYMKSPDEMKALFVDLPEAIANTCVIAGRCDVTIPTGANYLPAFDSGADETEPEALERISRVGLDARFAELEASKYGFDRQAYLDRLELELKIIISMGFPGYFLIVWDFIRWAKDHSIPVGPGRGSGAGSIVAWSLRITDIDPMQYGLLFERFLNPDRVSMPDFDIDFCQTRRGEVIEYVTDKYGKNNVGMIVTFGQLKAKAAMRDCARVLNLPFADADRLAKLIPDELNIKLADAYDREPRLREAIAEDETIAFLFESALALEGNNRNTGMHAAGVVISEEPLWEYVPIFTGTNGEYVSQYAKNEVEEAGLVKFDFLGLKTLTVIDDAVRLVNSSLAPKDHLDFSRISVDTPQVYSLISQGDTTGVFQMESDGFQRLMRQLKPSRFEEIVAAVALYRPGPLGSGMVEQFIECKHGRREVEYPHPLLEDVLAETYGVMVYQEQVMKVAQILAGYSLGGADLLRRAMGKKKPAEMDKQRKIFVEGASKKDISAEKANEIFDLMAHFAGYGFNKSHSAAYALITFQTAYLKRFHTPEFYAASMTNDAGSTEKVVKYIGDARGRGIEVLPPDVGRSEQSFTIDKGAVRFGLGAIKGLGGSPIEAIVDARATGPFTSLYDFCERVDGKRCGKRVAEALIRCGALDAAHGLTLNADGTRPTLHAVGKARAQMTIGLDAAFDRGVAARRDRDSGQSNLFGLMAPATPSETEPPPQAFPNVRGWSEKVVLQHEKQTLGFYVSGHPLDRYKDEVKLFADTTTQTVKGKENFAEVRLAGVVSGLRERPLKSGKGRMAFFQLEDHVGEVEVVVFAKSYDQVAETISSDEPLLLEGVIRIEGDGDERTWKVIANDAKPLAAARAENVRTVVMHVESDVLDSSVLGELREVFAKYPGPCCALFNVNFGTAQVEISLPEDVQISVTDDLLVDLGAVLGENSVRFR
ncbi:MAG: DNA polymerase-3 subunit alpha, partial [Flavobacteriales bacterium]